MNCPTCGAKNEADARFCAECGAPLEIQADVLVDDDDDHTILSTMSQVSEEAKTVEATPEDMAQVAEAMKSAEDAEFVPEASSPPPVTGDIVSGVEGEKKSNTQRYIIIGVLLFMVLCCCCCVLSGFASALSGGNFEDIINELSYTPVFSIVEPLV